MYDIASLLVSELAYMRSLVGDDENLSEVVYPGRVFPSHVFQNAGILEIQLNELLKHVKDYPDWTIEARRP